MGLKTTDYIILILLGIVCIFILFSMIQPIIRYIFKIEGGGGGEINRFIRYLGCSVVMCNFGCQSDETYTHALEYEGTKVVKSCNQLIEEYGFCKGQPPGTKLCSDNAKKYVINFTFKTTEEYRGDYKVNPMDPSTFGQCGYGHTGFQTDASCIGGWRDEKYFSEICDSCGIDITNRYKPAASPEGLLVDYEHGTDCGTDSGSSTHKSLIASIWVSDDFAKVKGNCGVPTSPLDTLPWCKFEGGKTFYIWTDRVDVSGSYLWNVDIFGFRWKPSVCTGGTVNCPKLVVCDHTP